MYNRELSVPEGGRAFKVYLSTSAHATIPVVLSPADLARVADGLGKTPADLTPADLLETLQDRAYENVPTLGICCSGGNRPEQPSLELSDSWFSADEDDIQAPLENMIFEIRDENL